MQTYKLKMTLLPAALSLMMILCGCSETKPQVSGKIEFSPDTLECLANDVQNNTMSECTKEYIKATSGFIK